MALGYDLIVTDSKGGEIKLSSMKDEHEGKEDIICVSFKSNTLNDEAIARSNDVRAEIKIVGRITIENKKKTCDLAKWSTDTDPTLIYRTVKLITHPSTSDTSILRSYEIQNMFVLDYTEGFEFPMESLTYDIDKENDNGLFEIYLVQKDGSYDLFVESE